MTDTLQRWRARADQLRKETYALYIAYRDPRVPWYAKLLAAIVVGYAFSPIDLIPDPIPVLGYLDDMLIVPFGIWLSLKMIPSEVMADARKRADEVMAQGKPVNKTAAAIIVLLWVLTIALIGAMIWRLMRG